VNAPRDALAAGGSGDRAGPREPGAARAAGTWRPTVPPAHQARWSFRISLANGDGATGAYLEFGEDGFFYNYIASQPRPANSTFRVDDDYAVRDVTDGHVVFYLRAADGELIDVASSEPSGSRPAQDLHCHLTDRAELDCLHEDQTAFSLAVENGHIIGRAGGERAEMNAVEPAPTNDEQRRRVLFLYAMYMVPTDTSSHDGDAGFFSGPE
jgi:hypothetical protein